jgi:hypothetical protein
MKNHLEVNAAEFKLSTKVFSRKRLKLGPVLLAYENGFLSIESGEVTVVMHATGEWHGRAIFSPEIMRALATVPPAQNPIIISYAEDHLLLGGMKIICQWNSVSEVFIHDLQNPDILDLLAMERNIPRAEMRGTGLGGKIRNARQRLERRIKNAAAQLEELEVTEAELRDIVEARIKSRLGAMIEPATEIEKIRAFFTYLEERIKRTSDLLDSPAIPSNVRVIVKTERAELEVILIEFKRRFLN